VAISITIPIPIRIRIHKLLSTRIANEIDAHITDISIIHNITHPDAAQTSWLDASR